MLHGKYISGDNPCPGSNKLPLSISSQPVASHQPCAPNTLAIDSDTDSVFTARYYAELGNATVCRLSVCLSVCDVQVP